MLKGKASCAFPKSLWKAAKTMAVVANMGAQCKCTDLSSRTRGRKEKGARTNISSAFCLCQNVYWPRPRIMHCVSTTYDSRWNGTHHNFTCTSGNKKLTQTNKRTKKRSFNSIKIHFHRNFRILRWDVYSLSFVDFDILRFLTFHI